eukprot:Rmarinus@m.23338
MDAEKRRSKAATFLPPMPPSCVEVNSPENSDLELDEISSNVEPCLLNNTVTRIPTDLTRILDLRCIFNYQNFLNLIPDEVKPSLLALIPGETEAEKLTNAKWFFETNNINHGHPIDDFRRNFLKGHFHPQVHAYRSRSLLLRKSRYQHTILDYHNRFVNSILEFKRNLLQVRQLIYGPVLLDDGTCLDACAALTPAIAMAETTAQPPEKQPKRERGRINPVEQPQKGAFRYGSNTTKVGDFFNAIVQSLYSSPTRSLYLSELVRCLSEEGVIPTAPSIPTQDEAVAAALGFLAKPPHGFGAAVVALPDENENDGDGDEEKQIHSDTLCRLADAGESTPRRSHTLAALEALFCDSHGANRRSLHPASHRHRQRQRRNQSPSGSSSAQSQGSMRRPMSTNPGLPQGPQAHATPVQGGAAGAPQYHHPSQGVVPGAPQYAASHQQSFSSVMNLQYPAHMMNTSIDPTSFAAFPTHQYPPQLVANLQQQAQQQVHLGLSSQNVMNVAGLQALASQSQLPSLAGSGSMNSSPVNQGPSSRAQVPDDDDPMLIIDEDAL